MNALSPTGSNQLNIGNWIYGSGGDIGIGTSTPTKRLEVVGSDALINGLTIGRGSGSILSNTALGVNALSSITTGSSNTAVGYLSL